MKIQICSDLHLEFEINRMWLKRNPIIPKGEILVIAGDTSNLGNDYSAYEFLQWTSKNFKRTYLIPGNHEYYSGYDISTAKNPSCQEILENVFLVNNCTIQLDDVKLIFSTMWSSIERKSSEVLVRMADFYKIRYKGERLSIQQYNEIHSPVLISWKRK